MEYLLSLLVVAGIAGFFYFRKKDKQKRNISIGLAVVSFILFGIFMPEESETNNQVDMADEPETEEVNENTSETEVVETAEESETEEEPEDEESEEVPEETNENIEFLDSGMALVTDNSNITFGETSHLEIFSGNHVTTLSDNYEQFENGVIFRNVMALQDQYGNQEDTNVIAVYYSPETINQINFENWPTLDETGLFEPADNVFIHNVLLSESEDFQQYTNTEGVPDEMLNYMGTTVE
jgi:hypothetical protein